MRKDGFMRQYFNVAEVYTSRDRSIGNRHVDTSNVPVEDLVVGKDMDFFGHKLHVLSIDEKEIAFSFRGVTYRLNREWQVIGTPNYSIPNDYIMEHERYVFYCSSNPCGRFDWEYEHAVEVYREMCNNTHEGNIWKNIPLARKFMHFLKDETPMRDGEMTPPYRAHLIYLVLNGQMINALEIPRLYQSYCELYRLSLEFGCSSDYEGECYEDYAKDFDSTYFKTVDRYIDALCWINDPGFSKHGISAWNHLGMLKADPIQASYEWDEAIYEVEREIQEELKDLPRGMGFCFAYWSAKTAALARRGIEWRTPGIMNPGVMFD